MSEVTQHFVTFYSPGSFVAEMTTHPIDEWDTDTAVEMARSIRERHGAAPYGFRFTTRTREPQDLDSHVSASSGLYWLGGKVETLAEVIERNDPAESILRQNMSGNGWDRIITNTNSYRWTQPLVDGDVVLDVDMRA